jgi:uncharacterized protein YbjT (DUF2867 family)
MDDRGCGDLVRSVPGPGRGDVKLQPVYVGDVAEAVAKALATEAAKGKIYELGGPRAYTYKALLQLVLQQLGRKRLLMPVPYFAWELLAILMAPLPNRPTSRDQVVLMKRDNVVSPDGAMTESCGRGGR